MGRIEHSHDFSFLVVIQIIDKLHVCTNEAEHQTPIARDIHCPKAVQLSMQGMKPVTRAIHI
ncbi:hypothetical protein C163_25690 [Pseudomonas sp. FGI182]|nr:hypothetical protein C163_25690 [Pseudomonas sp. FGI182]